MLVDNFSTQSTIVETHETAGAIIGGLGQTVNQIAMVGISIFVLQWAVVTTGLSLITCSAIGILIAIPLILGGHKLQTGQWLPDAISNQFN